MSNELGLPDDFVTKRPASLRAMLSVAKVPHVVVALTGAAWGELDGRRLALRSLAAGAMSEAVGAAIRWCETEAKIDAQHLYTDVGESSLELETQVQVLARALVNPDDATRPFVDGPRDVRELLTPEQVVWLFERFVEFQATRSPYEILRDQAKIEELADDLGKGFRSPTSLSSSDSSTLRRLVTSLVARLRRQTTPPFSGAASPTSSSDGSTPAT